MFINKNTLFLAVFTLFVINFQFQLPGKYYFFVVIDQQSLDTNLTDEGVSDYYGMNTTNLLGWAILLLLFRECLHKKSVRIVPNKFAAFTLFCWVSFLGITFFSSLYYSFYPSYSLGVWISLINLVVTFVATHKIFQLGQQKFIFFLLFGILIFQTLVAGSEFFTRIVGISTNENYISVISKEEHDLLPRVDGTFFFGNEFGLIIYLLVLAVAILLKYIEKKLIKILLGCSVAMATISILLSQSRVIWIAAFLSIGVGVLLIYLRFIKTKLQFSLTKKHVYYFILVLVLVALFVIPRLLVSQYFFDEYGGGTLRLQMISESWQVLLDSPWLGNGTSSALWVVWQAFPLGYILHFPYVVHLGYIQIALEAGIIGSLLLWMPFILLFGRTISIFVKNRLLSHYLIICLLFAILLFFCIHGLVQRIELPFLALFMAIIINTIQEENLTHEIS